MCVWVYCIYIHTFVLVIFNVIVVVFYVLDVKPTPSLHSQSQRRLLFFILLLPSVVVVVAVLLLQLFFRSFSYSAAAVVLLYVVFNWYEWRSKKRKEISKYIHWVYKIRTVLHVRYKYTWCAGWKIIQSCFGNHLVHFHHHRFFFLLCFLFFTTQSFCLFFFCIFVTEMFWIFNKNGKILKIEVFFFWFKISKAKLNRK